MASLLEQAVAAARQRIAELKRDFDPGAYKTRARGFPRRSFREALQQAAKHGPAIIAEIKRASPDKGPLRGSYPVSRIALDLQEAGAAAFSVATDPDLHHGSLGDLAETAAATNLPCLRKELLLDEVQLLESRAVGADAITLVVPAFSEPELRAMADRARALDLEIVFEVHNNADLDRAVAAGAEIIAANNRDLNNCHLVTDAALRLAERIPDAALAIAEGGIKCAEQLRALRHVGYTAFLVGDALMKEVHPAQALRTLLAESKAPPLGAIGVAGWPLGTKD